MKQFLNVFEKHYGYKFPTEFVPAIQIRTFNKNTEILQVGNEMDGFYFLLDGSYYVTSPESNGKELLLRRSTVPSILGDIELFQQCPVQSNCVAIEPCTFLFISFSLYEQHLKFDASFTVILLKELSFKLKTCTMLSRVNALSSVQVKLASYLCTIHDKQSDDYLMVKSFKDVADLIGTTSRHVNRLLKKWSDEQILERTNSSIKILDLPRLDEISEGIRYS